MLHHRSGGMSRMGSFRDNKSKHEREHACISSAQEQEEEDSLGMNNDCFLLVVLVRLLRWCWPFFFVIDGIADSDSDSVVAAAAEQFAPNGIRNVLFSATYASVPPVYPPIRRSQHPEELAAICAIVIDEYACIDEWIGYYYALRYTSFYIYDNSLRQ
jgi:hypothetical protein